MRTPRRLLLSAALVGACIAVSGVSLEVWRAQRALHGAVERVHAANEVPFTLRPLDGQAQRAANPGFEPVASSTAWTSGAALGETLYLSGPAGLAEVQQGRVVRFWRTGLELPPVPVQAVAVGRLRDSAEPQVLLATGGAGVLVLTPSAPSSLLQVLSSAAAQRDVTSLLVTPEGDLLLGTRTAGLLRWSGGPPGSSAGALRPEPIHLPGVDSTLLPITALAGGAHGVVAGTRDRGVLLLAGGTARRLGVAEGLPDEQVLSVAVQGTHGFVGTPVGVAEIDLSSGRVSRTLAPGLFARAMAIGTNNLLVGTMDQGLREVALQARLRPAAWTGQPANSIPSETPGNSGRVDELIAYDGGVVALRGGTAVRGTDTGWQPVLSAGTPAKSVALADPDISALTLAPDGRLWVGLFDRGVDVVDPVTMRVQRHLEDDHLFCINRLGVDPVRHTVAAATADGLVLFDSAGNPRQVLTQHDGLISSHINDLLWTPDGLTVATPAGLTFLNASGPESLYAFQGLVNNHVYTLAAHGRDLLAGTLGGLSLLKGGSVQRNLSAANSGLKHNWITAALSQPDGSWLVGTYGAGLERVEFAAGGTPVVTAEEMPAGTPRDLVINPNALLATPTAIYAGTLGQGMLVFNRAARRWTRVTASLPSENVTAFATENGMLYVGTENGLVRIEEARLSGGAR